MDLQYLWKRIRDKGKRDNHREREHREKAMIDIVKKENVKRSENGKFICKCGRDYLLSIFFATSSKEL